MADIALERFLASLADGTPVPAGGAAAALTAASAAALVGLASRVTARRAPAAGIEDIARAADRCRERAVALIARDGDAYGALVAARRASGPERAEAVRSALARATAIPVEIARVAHQVLALAEQLSPIVFASVRSDLGVAVSLAAAAVEAAVGTARVNTGELEDRTLAARIDVELDRLVADADGVRRRLLPHAPAGAR